MVRRIRPRAQLGPTEAVKFRFRLISEGLIEAHCGNQTVKGRESSLTDCMHAKLHRNMCCQSLNPNAATADSRLCCLGQCWFAYCEGGVVAHLRLELMGTQMQASPVIRRSA